MTKPAPKPIRERAWARADVNGAVVRNIYGGLILFGTDEDRPAWIPFSTVVPVEIRSVPRKARNPRVRQRCSQCGMALMARACGPTHASLRAGMMRRKARKRARKKA